jgi:hypothetical protein
MFITNKIIKLQFEFKERNDVISKNDVLLKVCY